MASATGWLVNVLGEGLLGSLAELSTGPLRAVAQPLIREMLGAGFNATGIVNELRSFGLGYRYQNMLADIRSLSTIIDNQAYMSRVSTAEVLSGRMMGERELPRDADFLVTFKVNVFNPATGATTEEFRSMYTNTLGSVDDYWGEFCEAMSETEYEEAFEYEYLGCDSVVHNAGFPYGD